METSIAESRESAWKPSLYYTIYGLFYFAQGLAMTAGPLWIPVYLREVFNLPPTVVTSTWALALMPCSQVCEKSVSASGFPWWEAITFQRRGDAR